MWTWFLLWLRYVWDVVFLSTIAYGKRNCVFLFLFVNRIESYISKTENKIVVVLVVNRKSITLAVVQDKHIPIYSCIFSILKYFSLNIMEAKQESSRIKASYQKGTRSPNSVAYNILDQTCYPAKNWRHRLTAKRLTFLSTKPIFVNNFHISSVHIKNQ